jgi:osmotically-inducible protein OsmY
MNLRLCAVLVAFVLVAGVCLAADKAVSDDGIRDYVRIRLASDQEVKGGDLGVEVKNGVVTLTGTVDNSHLKDKAGKLARKVKGVKQVVNNIEIKKHG